MMRSIIVRVEPTVRRHTRPQLQGAWFFFVKIVFHLEARLFLSCKFWLYFWYLFSSLMKIRSAKPTEAEANEDNSGTLEVNVTNSLTPFRDPYCWPEVFEN
jgi:hypothetical protein